MGGKLQFVVLRGVALSALAFSAHAHEPFGAAALPSFAALELVGVTPSLSAAHDSTAAALGLNGPSNGALLERPVRRDAVAFGLSWRALPWLSLDIGTGLVAARVADGTTLSGVPHVFEQAGATLYPARGWNASLFVNYFRMGAASGDQGIEGGNASFTNARLNHDLTKNARLSFEVLNVFDKRGTGIEGLTPSRLWSDPTIAENVLFDASETRGFRLRLRVRF